MKWLLLLLLTALTACSTVTQDNYLKIQNGMSEQEVNALLGGPTESSGFSVFGVSSSVSRWVGADAVITVRFVNGRVGIKSFDKPAVQ